MSYCRWLEGDIYAYRGSQAYVIHVTASAVERFGVESLYEEASAAALYERMLQLRQRGCELPNDALLDVAAEATAEGLKSRTEAGLPVWCASILTLYPEMFPGPLGASLAGRALRDGIWSLDTIQIRDFATDKHRSVDDTPAGGGAGMVMRADVLAAAVDHVLVQHPESPLLAMTPRGKPLTQAFVRELAAGPGVSILCGRFEGMDERLFEARPIGPVSIGDYVLSGGEVGALVHLDACVRLLPGVMGAASSGEEESFESGLLEYPHYTRPVEWEGRRIPEVLRSGDHARIAAWRESQAAADTRSRRPDLIERHGGARRPPPSGARREEESEEK
jgi:tRNA (guanine37-N1)-methyltransferase